MCTESEASMVLYPIGRKYVPKNKKVEARVTLLTVTPNDCLEDFVFPILETLGSAELEGLIRECTLANGHSELQTMAAAWALWVPVSRDQQVKRRKSHHLGRGPCP